MKYIYRCLSYFAILEKNQYYQNGSSVNIWCLFTYIEYLIYRLDSRHDSLVGKASRHVIPDIAGSKTAPVITFFTLYLSLKFC